MTCWRRLGPARVAGLGLLAAVLAAGYCSPGRPVVVRLAAACDPGDASPSPPRAPGAITYTRLTSIAPRFAGSLYDVFPGGCVSYTFDFTLGSQIALMEQVEQAVGLYPRQQLRPILKHELGVELSP